MTGHRQSEATPFFERLCPAMTVDILSDGGMRTCVCELEVYLDMAGGEPVGIAPD